MRPEQITTINLPIKAYKTDYGEPTCARQFPKEVCIFYVTVWKADRSCLQERCRFPGLNEVLEREEGGDQRLIPCKGCPIWPASARQ